MRKSTYGQVFLVPIVEPEVWWTAIIQLECCYQVTGRSPGTVFNQPLHSKGLYLGPKIDPEAHTVISGQDCLTSVADEAAKSGAWWIQFLSVCSRCSIPFRVIISGLSAHLNAMNVKFGLIAWPLLTFPFMLAPSSNLPWKNGGVRKIEFVHSTETLYHRVKCNGIPYGQNSPEIGK